MSYFPPQGRESWSPPPPVSPPPQRPKSNAGVVIGSVVAVVVLAGSGITAAILWTAHHNGSPVAAQTTSVPTTTESPEAGVEQGLRSFIRAVNSSSTGATVRVCAQYRDQWTTADFTQRAGTATVIDAIDHVTLTGSDAKIKYTEHQEVAGQPPAPQQHITLTMHAEDGVWLPCMRREAVHR